MELIFYQILLNESVISWDTSSDFSHLIYESPMVFAINVLGVTDINALAIKYSLTLFPHPILSLIACYFF